MQPDPPRRERPNLEQALAEAVRAQNERPGRVITRPPRPMPDLARPASGWRGARKPGLAGMALSLLLIGLNLGAVLQGGLVFRKALVVGLALLPVALAMIAFPGGVDLPMFTTRPPSLRTILAGLEPVEKAAWIGALVGGLIAGLGVAFLL